MCAFDTRVPGAAERSCQQVACFQRIHAQAVTGAWFASHKGMSTKGPFLPGSRMRLLVVEEPARGVVRCSWCRNRTGVNRVVVARASLALCDRCAGALLDEPRAGDGLVQGLA